MRGSPAFLLAACLVVSTLVARQAEAAPLSLPFTGTLTYVDTSVFPDLVVGQSFSGVYVYDDFGFDSMGGDPQQGLFLSFGSAYGFSTQVGASSFSDTGFSQTTVFNACCPGNSVDGFKLETFQDSFLLSQQILLYSLANQVTSSDQLGELLAVAPTSLFEFQRTWTLFDESENPLLIGELNSVGAVPEPTTLSLLGVGLAGAAVRRFRKRT